MSRPFANAERHVSPETPRSHLPGAVRSIMAAIPVPPGAAPYVAAPAIKSASNEAQAHRQLEKGHA